IEDRLGRIPYLLFYLASGIAATFTQAAIEPDSVIPQVGASGAIAGVLGAYLLWFPRASVTVVIPLFLVILPTSVPAVLMIGLWFVQNFLAGVATLGTDTAASGGVAVFAHLGGFIFGLLVALALIRRRPKRTRPPPPDPYIRMRY
ncbi:MAG: rhomboid family intramembrane serine protease, partial [Dehalococcoidia bacterium]